MQFSTAFIYILKTKAWLDITLKMTNKWNLAKEKLWYFFRYKNWSKLKKSCKENKKKSKTLREHA